MARLRADNHTLRRIEKGLRVSIGILLVAPFVLVLGMWSWNAKKLPFSAPSMEFVVERGDNGIQRVQAAGIPEHAARMAKGFHRCAAMKLDPELPGSVIVRQFECASGSEAPPPVFFRLSWQAGSAPALSRLSVPDALAVWNGGTEIPPVEYSISFGRAEAEALVEKCTSNARMAEVSQEFEAVFSRIAGPGALFGMEGPRLLISGSPGERWMAIRKRTVTGTRRSNGFFSFDAIVRPLWSSEKTRTGVASCVTGQWTVLLHTNNWQEHASFSEGGELHWLGEDHLLLTESDEPLSLLLIGLPATAAKPGRGMDGHPL